MSPGGPRSQTERLVYIYRHIRAVSVFYLSKIDMVSTWTSPDLRSSARPAVMRKANIVSISNVMVDGLAGGAIVPTKLKSAALSYTFHHLEKTTEQITPTNRIYGPVGQDWRLKASHIVRQAASLSR